MQTFLPYPNIPDSVKVLDNKRLGKQRVEAMQILNILEGKSKSNAWKNHPAVKMWKGYEAVLKIYMNACIEEWTNRGFKNTMEFIYPKSLSHIISPPWLGNTNFHASHRSNLLRKNPEWYSQFGWKESTNLPYIWPI